MKKRVLHIDENHPALLRGLEELGFENILAYSASLPEIQETLKNCQGLILRSRIPVDSELLTHAPALEFIGRVGSGLENIDLKEAEALNISVFAAPEGNRNAVGEHALGMLLGLLNKLPAGQASIAQGNWLREEHRGWELSSRTVGIIGYGHTGKSFAKNLSGFNCRVFCYDIKPQLGDTFAEQVSMEHIFENCDVISFHLPQDSSTRYFCDASFIQKMKNPFWLLNTSRGSVVNTQALVAGLNLQKIKGAGLDVLEFESASFASIGGGNRPPELDYLVTHPQVSLSPHVAGWTFESHERLAQTIVQKIKTHYQL